MKSPMDRRTVLGTGSLAAASAVLGSKEVEAESTGGRMTVHILDLYSGMPASGVKVDLFRKQGEQMIPLKYVMTDVDGRPEVRTAALGRCFLTWPLYHHVRPFGLFQKSRQDTTD